MQELMIRYGGFLCPSSVEEVSYRPLKGKAVKFVAHHGDFGGAVTLRISNRLITHLFAFTEVVKDLS